MLWELKCEFKINLVSLSGVVVNVHMGAHKSRLHKSRVLYICISCRLLAVGLWIMWFISRWDKNNCCYKLSKLTFSLKMVRFEKIIILIENIFCGFVQLLTTANNWHRCRPPRPTGEREKRWHLKRRLKRRYTHWSKN